MSTTPTKTNKGKCLSWDMLQNIKQQSQRAMGFRPSELEHHNEIGRFFTLVFSGPLLSFCLVQMKVGQG